MNQAEAHVAAFNQAVASGDWTEFLTLFHPDAVMTFEGVRAGPYVGRDAIAEAYRTTPPTDTMTIRAVTTEPGVDKVDFAWSHGATGSMTIHRQENLITDLAITFD
jgi:steroid delta-isomerase